MRRLSGLYWLLSALVTVACSSSAVDKNGAPTPSPPDTSVYDNCVDFATKLCADAKDCCNQAYGDFSPEGCLAVFKRDVCRPGADAVEAGRAVFDESAVEDCLAAHAQAHAVCVPSWQQTLELRKAIYQACRVIDGTTQAGGGCAIAATCKHPEGLATTDCVKNVCRTIEILPEGAACPFPSGAVSVCDDGLTCDAPGLETTGHCVKAIALGETCDGGMLEGIECGLGNYCDPETSQCMPTENRGGSGCAQSTECVSFSCNRTAKECAAAPAVVSRETCLGPPEQP
jgi:hypothetical protein